MFPDELARRIIKMFSYEGETILDPFLGSGTTIKIARELGRDGVGYEREDGLYKATIAEKLKGTEPATDVEPATEGVSEFSKRTLDELKANQPKGPEAETDELEKLPENVIYGTDSRAAEPVPS